jgi:general secretion pathway protein I
MVVKQRGFTLLELLVAMAILAMTGVTLMRVSSEHIRSVSYLEELSVASMIAENQLQLARLDTKWPPKPRQDGQVEMAKRKWKWIQETLETDDPNFRLVRVKVSTEDNPDQVVTTLTTFIGRSDD